MISPYEYLDFRAFLRDWFKDRKGRPSMRSVAVELECSVAQLSRVINATRDLSAQHAEALASRVTASDGERTYFLDLVDYEQGATLALRREALDRLMTVRRFRSARRVTDQTYALMSRWYYCAIADMARCEGFQSDPEWIARRLIPRITTEQAAEAIEALLDLGQLVRDGEGLAASDGIWATEHETGKVVGLATAHLHRAMLDRAKEAIDGVPAPRRHVAALALPVNGELVAEIKQRIAQFHMEVMNLVAKDVRPKTHVVQLQMQLFPLSRTDDDEDDDF